MAARKLMAQSKQWTTAHVQRGLRVCATADLRFKSSGGGRSRERLLVEELLLTLCGGAGMGESAIAT